MCEPTQLDQPAAEEEKTGRLNIELFILSFRGDGQTGDLGLFSGFVLCRNANKCGAINHFTFILFVDSIGLLIWSASIPDLIQIPNDKLLTKYLCFESISK